MEYSGPPDTVSALSELRETAVRLLRMMAAASILLISGDQVHGGSRLIEIRDSENSYTGKLVAMDDSSCVLFDRMGVMHTLNVRSLTGFERIADKYSSHSVSEFRTRLKSEFPKGYQLAGTSHYIVCGPTGKSQTYANLFEDVFRTVDSYYRVRGFDITPPDTPLVAIVFGTQAEFADYCRKDQVQWGDDLRGYYSLKTNRIAMFDDPTLLTQTDAASDGNILSYTGQGAGAVSVIGSTKQPRDPGTGHLASSGLSGDTAGTIIHEATHQVSYNIGIHSRAGVTPTWICEGLATLLEAPGIRNSRSSRSADARVNEERMEWFRAHYSPQRQNGDLARLISDDQLFQQKTLDAYSMSWAFTFFLAENPTYTRRFIRYLKVVSDRDPMRDYSVEDRLSDFTGAFGDPAEIEVDFLRFMDRL